MPDGDDSGAEKRKFKRIDQHFMAKFRTGAEETWHTFFLRDLGAGGILFNYGSELEVGSQIRLSITFPVSEVPIECSATVIRVRPFSGVLKIYEIAACFTEIDENQQELINRAAEIYLSKKEKKARGN